MIKVVELAELVVLGTVFWLKLLVLLTLMAIGSIEYLRFTCVSLTFSTWLTCKGIEGYSFLDS